MNSNKNLFYYGVWANLKGFLGCCLLPIALYYLMYSKFILAFGIFGLSVVIIISAKATRFDYQRQSGSIIHKGDW